jgi:hypothetical protein
MYDPLIHVILSTATFMVCMMSSSCRISKLGENSLDGWNLDILDLGLVLSIADGTILLDNHSPATSAIALVRANLPAVVLREESLVVSEHEEVFALRDTVDLAPSVEDEFVIVGDEGDNIDALGLEFLELLDVGREVVGGAAGGESTWWWLLVSCFESFEMNCMNIPGTATMTTFLPAHSLLAS